MRAPRIGSGFTVFVLFFGIALLDAVATRAWLRVAFWCAIALVFLWADTIGRHVRASNTESGVR